MAILRLYPVLFLFVLFSEAMAAQLDLAKTIACLKLLKDSLSQSSALDRWEISANTTIEDVCRFRGVSCDSEAFRVSLASSGLHGSFILNTSLSSSCSGLKSLSLSNNSFTGPLPSNLCDVMPDIIFLSFSSNKFTGSIPDFSHCSKLSSLDLSRNRFSGNIPEHLCSSNTLLTTFSMSNNSLTGDFRAGLENCSGTLDLSNNSLSGEFPTGLRLKKLTSLDVSGNDFSGVLYSYLQRFGEASFANNPRLVFQAASHCASQIRSTIQDPQMYLYNWENNSSYCSMYGVSCYSQGLSNVSLRGRGLTGKFPTCFEDWVGLVSLDLGDNSFTGDVPRFEVLIDQSQTLTRLDISYNMLTGDLPATFHNLTDLNIAGNLFNGTQKRGMRKLLYYMLPLAVLLVASLWYCYSSRSKSTEHPEDEEIPVEFRFLEHLHLNNCDFLDLTENFNSRLIIGNGASSTVYQGVLSDGQLVAVKRLLDITGFSRKLFLKELQALGKIRHRNVVKVLGYYSNLDVMAVILEYMPYGTVDKLLHPLAKTYPLEWSYRYAIAIEVAEGLKYLHHDCEHPIVHCDLKPSNILLDEEFRARIADFGFAKLLGDAGTHHDSCTVSWTIGYAAPEVAQGARPSPKADVYSFGIILMELVTGERPCDSKFQNCSIRDHVRNAMQGEQRHRILDMDIQGDTGSLQEIFKVLCLAIECTEHIPNSRPDASSVLASLVSLRKKNPRVTFSKTIQELAHQA